MRHLKNYLLYLSIILISSACYSNKYINKTCNIYTFENCGIDNIDSYGTLHNTSITFLGPTNMDTPVKNNTIYTTTDNSITIKYSLKDLPCSTANFHISLFLKENSTDNDLSKIDVTPTISKTEDSLNVQISKEILSKYLYQGSIIIIVNTDKVSSPSYRFQTLSLEYN